MGKHLAHSRTTDPQLARGEGVRPNAIRYTLAKRLAIMSDIQAGLSYNEVAARHNVSKSTIHAIVNNPQIQEMLDPKTVETRRKNMAAFFEYHADVAMSTLTHEKWDKASALQHIIGAATAYDKARLARGETTENLGVLSVMQSASNEIELLKKRRQALESAIIDVEIVDNQHSTHESKHSDDTLKTVDNQQADISTNVTVDNNNQSNSSDTA